LKVMQEMPECFNKDMAGRLQNMKKGSFKQIS
jgi:hypothetical protein